LAGGAKVTIEGSGFSPDHYEGANHVFFGGIPCDVDWFNSANENRLVCWTRPWPEAKEEQSSSFLETLIVVGRISYRETRWYRQHRYNWWYTPRMESVSPRSSVFGNVVLLRGWFITNNLPDVQRVMLGDAPCELYKPDTATLYREKGWSKYEIYCLPGLLKTGFFNATVHVPKYGWSWNHSKALQPGPNGQLYMFEFHPDVTSVYPNIGSSDGGTLLRITGSSFGNVVSRVSVNISGVPCQVQTVTDKLITCFSGPPLDAMRLNSSAYVSFMTPFEGVRGVSMAVWKSIRGTSVSELLNSAKYPDQPDVYYNLDQFASPINYGNYYGLEMEAFFISHYDSLHSFFFSSDDSGELWFSNSSNISEAVKIAYVPGHSSRNYYKTYPSQIAAPVYLKKGQKCYLRALAKEHGGGDFAMVAVLVHNPPFGYTSWETKAAVAEQQQVIITASTHPEIQSITVNYNSSATLVTPVFTLEWDGRQSSPLDVEATNEQVRDAVLDLFEGKCVDNSSEFLDLYDHDTFEDGSSEYWSQLDRKPVAKVVYDDAYCGRKSLQVVSGYALNFNGETGLETGQDSFGYSAFDYPFVCMAYRIPTGTHLVLTVNVQDLGWFSIPLTEISDGLPYKYLSNWEDVNGQDIQDDNMWHYSCFDLGNALGIVLGEGEAYYVVGIGFASPEPEYRRGPFYIDEFAIASEVRQLVRTYAPARPNGLILETVEVSNTSMSDGDSKSVTFRLEYEATTCFDNFSLIGVNVLMAAVSEEVNVTTSVLQSASDAVVGTFQLGVFGLWTPPIAHDANNDEFESALESISELGDVSVYSWLHDFDIGCSGRAWGFRLHEVANDVPTFEIRSNLSGQSVTSYVQVIDNGGILFDPIPGYMLRTVEKVPHVQVAVNDVYASCQGSGEEVHATRYSQNTACQFVYSDDAKPIVTSLSPESGFSGDTVTIYGSGFISNTNEYDIRFNNVSCNVTNATETAVQCIIGKNHAGKHQLHFQVYSSGRANTSLYFTHELSLELLQPTEGSLGGGLIAGFIGNGVVDLNSDTNVSQEIFFGSNLCKLVSSDFSYVECVIPPSNFSGSVTITIIVYDKDGETISAATAVGNFTYSDAITPHVNSVSPTVGSAGGGVVITISGDGFSTTAEENVVKIGEAVCLIVDASNETIVCQTRQVNPGSYDVVVAVDGKGSSKGSVQFTYELMVDSLSYMTGSVFGGQKIIMSGSGFGDDSSLVHVLLGDVSCRVEVVSNNVIQCMTKSSAKTHYVNNFGRHPEYGIGYQWQPQHLTIQVGDTVEWHWSGSSFTVLRSVVQVANENATEYDGTGFRSEPSTNGMFRHNFDEPGIYFYVSEGHGELGFRGTVTVTSLETRLVPITVMVNGIAAEHSHHLKNASLIAIMSSCQETDIPDDIMTVAYYSYSLCETPLITDISSTAVHLGEDIIVQGALFADGPLSSSLNTLTIGGKACLSSPDVRLSSELPRNATTLNSSEIGSKLTVSCTVPKQPPGLYRVIVHVSGRGWGFASLKTSTVKYEVAYSVNTTSGSVYGGTELVLSGVGFHPKAALSNVVKIGNAVCDVQSLVDSDEWGNGGSLTCITRKSLHDGYSAVVNENQPLGYWKLNDEAIVAVNSGSVGAIGNGVFQGDVVTRVDGISGNNWTNSAVQFNASWLEVPYLPVLNSPSNITGELWVNVDSGVNGYQFVIGSYRVGQKSEGYAIWINPCSQVEFWLAVDMKTDHNNSKCEEVEEASASGSSGDNNSSSSGDLEFNSCNQCDGYRTVSMQESIETGLPAGVWSVMTGPAVGNSWSHIVFSWLLHDTSTETGIGHQMLYMGGLLVENRNTNFSHNLGSPLLIGGQIFSGENISVDHFAGVVDEVAFYNQPLSEDAVAKHFHYGTSDLHPAVLQYDMEDYRGEGTVPKVKYPPLPKGHHDIQVNWTSILTDQIYADPSDRLQFYWTGFHSVVEVGKNEFESCMGDPLERRTVWGLAWTDSAATVVDLESGRLHYFISDVTGDCESGHKLQVFVGRERVIEWGLGRAYEPISIAQGTGLQFQWSEGPGLYHDVVEVVNKEALEECAVGHMAEATGSVVARYSQPATTGNVVLSSLSVGMHYFACAVSGHCDAGMHIIVAVTGDGEIPEDDFGTTIHQTVNIYWRIQHYSDIVVTVGDSVVFDWDAFHSLSQVTKVAYDDCDISSPPLKEWARASVAGSVVVSGLAPGSYYFICAVGGHCQAGMKVTLIVKPKVDGPSLMMPQTANCLTKYCSYTYREDNTPVILDIEPDHGVPGTVIIVTGRRLLKHDYGANASLLTVLEVRIGDSLCEDPMQLSYSADNETVSCVVSDQPAGDKSVTIVIYGAGFGSYSNNVYESSGRMPFMVEARVETLSPNEGSIAGGTVLNIVGSGFSYVKERIMVMVGDYECLVSYSSFNEIKCVTASVASFPHVHDSVLHVSVLLGTIAAESSAYFMYSTNATSFVTNVSSSVLQWGDEISIYGQFHTTDTNEIEAVITRKASGVQVQGKRSVFHLFDTQQECHVTFVNEGEIRCIVGRRAAGDHYAVVVKDINRGYAVSIPESAADISYELRIDSVTPTTFGLGGGVELTLTGVGFLSATFDGEDSEFGFNPEYSSIDNQKEAATVGQSLTSSNFHGKLVSSFGMDYGVTFAVDVCGQVCYIRHSTYNKTVCIVPPVELNKNITITDMLNSEQICSVKAVVSGSAGFKEGLSPSNITYSGSLTPIIESLSPRRGGTAGGTLLTITGSGFESTISGKTVNVSINIDGVECSLRDSNDSLLTCRTNPHKTTLDGLVTVVVPGKGRAVEFFLGNATTPSSAQFEYVDRWSSRFTWGGNDPPGEGAAVHIQAGQTVLLDTSPSGVLSLLLIDGNLIFDDNQDIHLQAKYILILRGKLQVGTEEEPFMHRAVITLHGNIRDPEIPIYGAKVLGLRQGTLDLHGRPRAITWTRLAETVYKNESILELVEPVDWLEDDIIVIASTSKDGNETETASIRSVENSGHRIILHKPINYTHYGITDVMDDGQFIDIRAEVGLLSHNVIVQGSQYVGDHLDEYGADQYGSQIMIHRAGADPTPVRLEHVEVRHGGQAFRLGRYAVHFHLSDIMNGSYVRHCSIHHSHNRAITAHGVHEMLFEGVVAYDIKGHTFFIEDGIETGNRYIRNLGLVTRGSSSLLNTDQLPATFWITNPNNTFIGNAAAGSRAYGFWYDLDATPSGPSFTTSVCPNQAPLGEFRDNVAHTNAEFGFRIWEKYLPRDRCWGNDIDANFYNLVSYANGIHGVELSVVGHVRLIGFKVADNRDNGIEILEAHGSWGGPMIKDTLIISHSIANKGKAQTGGIKTPNRRRLTISNVTFARFDDPSLSCLRACSHCKVRQGGFQYWFEKIKYLGNSSLHRATFQWEHEVLFKDLDGTLAGVPGGWVTPSNGLLPPNHCEQRPEYSLNSAVPGSVCTQDVQPLRLAWNNAQPLATFKGRDVIVANEHGSTLIPWRHYRLTHMDGYMLTLPSHRIHNLTYILPPSLDVDNTQFSAGLYNVPKNESVIIQTFYDTAPDHFRVGSNRKDIGRPLTFSDPHTSWHFDNKTLELQYILSARGQTAELSDLEYGFSKEPCPVTGCPAPKPGDSDEEDDWRRWSNPLDWPDSRVPLPGSNVTIEGTWKMYLDLPEVDVEKLDIKGRLKFKDSHDIVLNATWIIIVGHGSLEVGEEASPFSHQATINLKGNRRTPDFAVSRSMILGSKAIGVFGELRLFGRPRNVVWTRLNQSAMAGDRQLHLESSASNVDWQPGEEIVIAPSSYIPLEAEIRTIESVSGSVVTLEHPLQYDHVVDVFLTSGQTDSGNGASRWWNSNGGLRIAPEVGILSHNVRVVGTEDIYNSISVHEFGCRVLVGSYRRGRSRYTGKAFMDSVQFQNCGQGGFFSTRDPRYVVAFKSGGDEAGGSYIRRSSVHTGFNTAFGTLASNNISISDNVVYRSVDSMFRLRSVDCTLERNLGVLTRSIQVARPKDDHAVDFPATFEISGSGHTVKDNVAAGSERVGFYYPGESCVNEGAPDISTAKFWGNSAHTGMMGLVVMGLTEPCSAVGGFVAARQWEYGIFSSIASRLAVRQVAVAVGHTGLCLNVFGPDPVKHLLDYKWIKVDDSLIVGSTEEEPCFSSTPAHCPSICAAAGSPKLGIMMATFAKKRSKMDGTGPWHKVKSYPTIAGQVNLTSVTFARFGNYQPCEHDSFAVGNNELSPDAMHPNYFENTKLIDVDPLKIAHLWPPNPAWIVQEDCIDMDCDGPKHSMISDIDGQLVGTTSGTRGSIIPEAELRFDITRLPEVMRYSDNDPTKRLDPESIVEHRGIARGNDGTFDGSSPGCVWVPSWNAYKCSGLNHQMLVIESMDADTEVRRISPIALHGGDTGSGKYTDLMNGPMDHGWCTYYTCLKRLSTFFSIVAVGTDYQLWFTGSNPGHLRFHLLNTYGGPSDVPGEGIRISIWYKNPQRKDVYKDGVFIEPENVQLRDRASRPDGTQYIPQLQTSHSGANYFDRRTQTLHLVVKGSKPIEVTTPPVVQVAFDLAVSIDDFFDPATIVRNLAFVLKIPEELIRVVDLIAEDSAGRRRRASLNGTTESVKMVVEIGDPPATNITQPETPSVSDQIEEEGGTPFFPIDDNEDNTTDTNTTDTTEAPPSYSTAGILAKDEDPPSETELASEFDNEKQVYESQQSAYAAAVDQTNFLNELANQLVEQVQTGQFQFDNATVIGMSVTPAPPPPEPVQPVAPPGLENLTTSTGEKIYSDIDVVTAAPLLVTEEEEDNASNIVFQIPFGASLSRQPPSVSGHLLYDIPVIVEDANGQPVENLGWTETWYCTVTLVHIGSEENRPVLEGQTRVLFQHGGHALFTGLRISQPADNLRLEFFVTPSNYTVRSNAFSVVSPTLSSTVHQTVQFTFNGDYDTIVVSGPGGPEGFLQELGSVLAKKLGIDVSRLTNLNASSGSIICTVTIFEKANTDPPDTPTLQSTLSYLKRLVEADRLTMTHGVYNLTATSFRESKDDDTDKEPSSSSLPIWVIAVAAAVAVLIIVALVLLWVKICAGGKKRKVDPTNHWAVTPRHHRLQSAEVGHMENVYVEQSTDDIEMRTLDEIPVNVPRSGLTTPMDVSDRGPSPSGSTTGLLSDSPPQSKNTSRSSLSTPRHSSRDQTRRVVVSPKPPGSPEMGGEKTPFIGDSGTTSIMVVPSQRKKSSSSSVSVSTTSSSRPGSKHPWHYN
jgi:plastocyanin